MLFQKIKSLISSKANEDEAPRVDQDKLATKGLKLNDYAKVEYPMLELEEDILFKLGNASKKITGTSVHTERGDSTHRFYTEDDYLIQVDYFGENKTENLKSIAIFQYQVDEGEEFDADNTESVEAWRKIIEQDDTFTFDGKVYTRDSGVLGGLEIAELAGGDKNSLENTFAVFTRELSKDFHEFVLVNVEQEVSLNSYNEIIERGDLLATIAIGVAIPHTQLSVIRN